MALIASDCDVMRSPPHQTALIALNGLNRGGGMLLAQWCYKHALDCLTKYRRFVKWPESPLTCLELSQIWDQVELKHRVPSGPKCGASPGTQTQHTTLVVLYELVS